MIIIQSLGCRKKKNLTIILHLNCNTFLHSSLSLVFIVIITFVSLFFEIVESSKMLPLKLAVIVDAQGVTDGA